MRAVILAGGKGTRLKPYTTSLPKPLMPINGELPILEIVLKQLKRDGFTRVTLAVSHLAEIIMAFCADGRKWGLAIDYSMEKAPLSTIGPLTLIEDLPEYFLLMNGDILTDLRFNALVEAHVQSGADVTVGTFKRSVKMDFGVIEYADRCICTFQEKPVYHFDVSMGIYVINRKVIDALQKNQPYGFDNLMLDGIKNGMNMRAFPYDGFWLDIGRPDDYDLANEQYESLKDRFL
ncbi:MAG: NTP transferase domain-containing protein [Acidobacteriia bacterium]|nr:NTP transferase domain-containing protein [Terriglobia bacterium]